MTGVWLQPGDQATVWRFMLGGAAAGGDSLSA
jgi:hypothetical protein